MHYIFSNIIDLFSAFLLASTTNAEIAKAETSFLAQNIF